MAQFIPSSAPRRPKTERTRFTNLDRIAEALRRLPRKPSPATQVALFNLSASIARPAAIREILRSAEADPRRLSAIARRSFRHSNHFDKIVLLDDETEGAYRLALHLWRPPFTFEDIADDQIHDHRCDFWSTVLFGSVESSFYARSDHGEQYQEFTYIPARSDFGVKVNEYQHVGSAVLQHTQTAKWHEGSTYHLPYDQIHRIVISRHAPTATLLIRGPHRTNATSIFSNNCRYEDMTLEAFETRSLHDRFSFVHQFLS